MRANRLLHRLVLLTLTCFSTQLATFAQNGPTCDTYVTRNVTNSGLASNTIYGIFAVAGPTSASVYAATNMGLGISTDGGNTFTNRLVGNSGLGANQVFGVFVLNGIIYAATTGGLSISTDGGTTFVNRTTSNGLGSNSINGVYAVSGPGSTTVYAATTSGLGVSTDGGTTFVNRTTSNGLGSNGVNGVYAVSGPGSTTVYAATNAGVGISTNGGTSFTNRTNGLITNTVNGVYAVSGPSSTTVYAAVTGGLGISTNGGTSFTTRTSANSGLGLASGSNPANGVFVLGNTVYAAVQGGLSISTDRGNTFTNYTTANGLGNNFVSGVHVAGGVIYAATNGGVGYCNPTPLTITGLAASPNPVCASSPVTFTATVSNVTGSYNYTLTNGSSPLSGTATGNFSQTLTASSSGVQPYTLTVSSGGQSATAVTSLTVGQSGVARLYVKANATGANTGLSWQDAFTDLQSALKYPCLGSLREIWIARGVYNRGAQPFSMLPDVAIYGGFEGTETDLSQRPLINLSNPPSTTLTGQGPFNSGFYYIIQNIGSLTNTAILDGVEITIPTSGSLSSGITNRSFNSQVCSPQFRNLLFRGYVDTGNAATSSGLFVQNDASSGGEVSPSFVNCVFRDNQAINLTGRFYNVSFPNSIVRPQFINCAIANHTGDSFLLNLLNGGQIQPQFINCSFLNVPNGISFSPAPPVNGSSLDFRFTNCVLWNTGGNNTFRTEDANFSYTATAQYSLLDQAITGFTSGPGNLTTTSSPFLSASDPTLPNTSPAVNAGNPASVTVANGPYSATNLPQTDAAANPRIVGSRVDMGALEVQNPVSPCGTVVYVTQNGAGLQNGSSWENAFAGTALQTAINTAATCGAQVWVAQGIYKPTTGTDRSISFVMKAGVKILGGFVGTERQLSDRPIIALIAGQPNTSTLSGDLKGDDGSNFANSSDNSYHVIKNDDNGLNNTAVLDGFVISSGNANGNGTPDMRGGAIYNVNSSPSLINCSLQNNSSALNGGAIYNVGSNLSLINCSLQNNTASNGGAIYNNVSNPSLVNCLLQANAVTMNGGAIYNNISSPGLINCSLQNNSATLNGGAIYNMGNSNPNLINSVLFNNGGANTFVLTGGASLSASYSLFEPNVTSYTDGGNNLTTTLTPFVSTTSTQLRDCSVAINTGSNSAYSAANGPTTDLAGNPRFFNSGVIDRGAYEYQGNPTTLTVTNPAVSTATVNQPFSQSFTASGGSGSYSYSVVSSNLPSSLSLSASGVLSGTPTVAGSYSVLVQASDTNGCVGVASSAYSLTVGNAAPPCGAVVYVTQNGAGLQNGSSWANAFAGVALQTAINTAATCGAQVWVAQGIYKPTTGTDARVSFVMKPAVAIYGGFRGTEGQLGERPGVNPVTGQPSSSTLSGDIGTPEDSGANSDNSGHVVRSEPGLTASAVLDGFVITKGNATNTPVTGTFESSGGGFFNTNANPTIRNCFFIDNFGSDAGGIYTDDSSPTIINCRFESNTAASGGAIFTRDTGTITITGCLFEKHNEGGAIYSSLFSTARVVVSNSTFRQNTGYSGGAFRSGDRTALELTDCLLENNTSSNNGGGAIYSQSEGSLKLTRCQFVNNRAQEDGGAVYFQGDVNLEVTGCRFTGNSAVEEGGAISFTGSSLTLTNSLFENNRGEGGDGGGAVFVNGDLGTIVNTSFVSNTATNGGAVFFYGTNHQVANGSFVNNVATGQGGAIYDASGSLQLTNSSFQGNQAPQGGAMYTEGDRSQLVNSVLFNNGGANTFVLTNGVSLSVSYSLFEPSVTGYTDAGNNLTTTLSPFTSTTSTQLRDCAPAINTGSNQAYSTVSGPETDLAGNPRFFNSGVIDRGAYEYQGNPTTLTVTNPAVSTATVGQGFSQSFTASGGSGSYSFSVVSSNLPTSLSVSASGVLSGTPTVAGSYSVLVSARDQNGCVGVASTAYNLTVGSVAAPTLIGLSVTPNPVCAGSPVTFTATVGNVSGSYGYTLTNGSGPISGTASGNFSQNLTTSGSGSQSFTLTVSSNDQVVSATTSLSVTTPPSATIAYTGAPFFTNGPAIDVSRTGAAGGVYSASPAGLSVNAGTGQITPASSTPGSYTVSYTIEASGGCPSFTATTLVSIEAPQADLAIICTDGQTSVGAGNPVSYTIVVSNAGPVNVVGATVTDNFPTSLTGISWTAVGSGGGSVAASGSGNINELVNLPTGASVTFIVTATLSVTATGTLTNTVTVTAPTGFTDASPSNNTATDINTIIPAASTIAGLSASPNSVCVGSPVRFTATVGNITGSYSYTLANGNGVQLNGTASTPAFSQSLTASGSGSQSFTLTVSGNGQTATATTTLTVNALPVASLVSSGTLTCANTSVTLTAGGGSSYSFSAGASQIGSSNQALVTSSGTYSVTVASASGCVSTTSTLVESSTSAASVSISPASALLTCTSPTVSLTALGAGNVRWNTNETSPVISVSATGTYSVTLTNASSCTATAS
ncbi:beta strand repeat-containing protein, partial [Spirosoma soli]